MAAPDRAYRFFTNLISKTVEGNNTVKHYIRCAKPLQGYVGSNQSLADQAKAFKAKFKVDGILWIKNNDVPKTANDDPNTVTITLPDEVDEHGDPVEITLVDPDLGDPNRDGIIAYVYPNSPNAKYHDIRTQGIQGSSNTTDYSTRSWSRASKFRFIDYDHNYPNSGGESAEQSESVAAIILNDAGLNRRGDCELHCLIEDEIEPKYALPYIDQSSNSAPARFNDIQMEGYFYSTPYNRLYYSKLLMAQKKSDTVITPNSFEPIANYGPIGRTGIAGNPDTPILVKFVGRRDPNAQESGRIATMYFPPRLIEPTYSITQGTSDVGVDCSLTVSIPQYVAKLETRNEEGTVESEQVENIDIALYRWNTDDSIKGSTSESNMYSIAHKTNTDRISISHTSAEKSIERYNAQLPITTNQLDQLSVADSDPNPRSRDNVIAGNYANNDVEFVYTAKETFPYNGDPIGRPQGLTLSNLLFLIRETPAGGKHNYRPLQTGPYIISKLPDGGASTGEPGAHEEQAAYYSSFLTLRCKIYDTITYSTPTELSGVFCIEYSIYPNYANSGNWPFIRRYWQLEYDGVDWYWPKSRYNQNVTVVPIINLINMGNHGRLGVTTLTDNTDYYLTILLNNINKDERYSITVTKDPVASTSTLTFYSWDSVNNQWVAVEGNTWSSPGAPGVGNTSYVSSGKTTRLNEILKVVRSAESAETMEDIIVTVNYLGYENMAAELTTKSTSSTLTVMGAYPDVLSIRMFNAIAQFDSYVKGVSENPQTILAAAVPLNNDNSDRAYYIRASDNVLCTSAQVSNAAEQGYYISHATFTAIGEGHFSVSAKTSDIFYVDATGKISALSSGGSNSGGGSSSSGSGGNSGTPGGNTGGLDNGS